MFASQPDLRVFSVNGHDVLSISGVISEANVMGVCERIDERVRTKTRPYEDPTLDLGDRDLDPLTIGHLMRCVSRNQIRPKVLRLSGNRLTDFDFANSVGFFVESLSGRFLSELELSDNRIGDFGCITILQALLMGKSSSTDRRVTVVRLNNNFITHPYRILEAVPPGLRSLIFAPGISPPGAMDQAVLYLYGLEDQRVPRAKRDCAKVQQEEVRRRPPGIREPDDDDY